MTLRQVLAALLLTWESGAADAHRLDEYLQSTTLRVEPDRVALYVRLVPGVEVARQVWETIDTDRSGELSRGEQEAYANQVLRDLALSIDGKPKALEIIGWSFPAQPSMIQGMGQISLNLHAEAAISPGPHRLHVETRHLRALSTYLVNTLVPVDREIRITGQQRSVDQAMYDLQIERESIAVATGQARIQRRD